MSHMQDEWVWDKWPKYGPIRKILVTEALASKQGLTLLEMIQANPRIQCVATVVSGRKIDFNNFNHWKQNK